MQPSDIAVVKAMKNPPAGVKLVMESVCVMMGIQPQRVNDPAGTGRKVSLSANFALKLQKKLPIATVFIVFFF